MSNAKTRKSKKYPGVYVIENASGKLSYGIDYTIPDGERVKKVIKGCNSERKANEIRSIEMAAASQGILEKKYGLKGKVKTLLFHKAIDLYGAWAETNKKSYYVEKFKYDVIKRSPIFKRKLVTEIHPLLVEKYKLERLKTVNKKTVNHELIVCRQAVQKMIEWGKHSGENPFKAVDNYKVPRGKRPGSLNPTEVRAIMDHIDHPVKKDMVAFAYYTGWRIGSIRKLRKEDYNREHRSIWMVDPKNGVTVELALGDSAADIVERNIERSTSEYVFCKHNGDPYVSAMNGIIGNAAGRAGVTLPAGKKWHAFRRTWTTYMFKTGADIGSVRELGTWRDDDMPLWYNDGMRFDEQREILNRIPKLDEQKDLPSSTESEGEWERGSEKDKASG
jgi:integrase